MYWQKFISKNWQKITRTHCMLYDNFTTETEDHTQDRTVYKVKCRFGSWNNIIYQTTQSSEQVFCCCHGFRIHLCDLVFNFQKSTHTLLKPSFFTMMMGDTYGDVDGLITPISSIASTSFLNSSLIAYGKGYGLHLIGISSANLI